MYNAILLKKNKYKTEAHMVYLRVVNKLKNNHLFFCVTHAGKKAEYIAKNQKKIIYALYKVFTIMILYVQLFMDVWLNDSEVTCM